MIPWLLSFVLIGFGVLTNWRADAVEVQGRASVSDGDTLWINDQEIRLFGIDAFEAGQFCKIERRSYDCGAMSESALKAALRSVIICRGTRFDRYDRLLAVCFADERDINAALVEGGYALAYRRYSTDYIDEERRAQARGAGAWSGDFETPWDFRGRNER